MSMMVAPLKQTLHLALNSSAPNQTNTYTVSSVQEAVSLTPELQVSLATLFGSCQVSTLLHAACILAGSK
eukprot:m.83579 g.83579  ORF g.83579 m.83579 type:complete len:70 (+) comp14655_c0_seq37:5-214(+)